MKIIDLLNKIANDEDVPKKIRYDGIVFELENGTYQSASTYLQEYLSLDLSNLNDEVEIIEDKKIEERLPIFEDGDTFDTRLALNQERRMINKILDKINEVE